MHWDARKWHITFAAVMHGTKTRPESGVMANCMALLVWRRTMSKFTSVLQQDSTSHNLNLESEPKMKQKQRGSAIYMWAITTYNVQCTWWKIDLLTKKNAEGWFLIYYFLKIKVSTRTWSHGPLLFKEVITSFPFLFIRIVITFLNNGIGHDEQI